MNREADDPEGTLLRQVGGPCSAESLPQLGSSSESWSTSRSRSPSPGSERSSSRRLRGTKVSTSRRSGRPLTDETSTRLRTSRQEATILCFKSTQCSCSTSSLPCTPRSRTRPPCSRSSLYVVAVAALPLYLLARDITHSSRLGLISAVTYLAWTPTLSSNLYDFHAEAFLPLELIVVVLLWERERYWAGAAVVGVSFATLELAPVLLFFVGVFFLLPSRVTWLRWRSQAGDRFPWTAWVNEVRPALRSPRIQASLALAAASLAVYFLLVFVRLDVLNPTLGISPLPSAASGYVIGNTPASLGLSFANIPLGFYSKITYWVVIVALLGFVPFLAPRALILSLPWFGFTMLSSNLNYVQLGFQYGFIAAAPMLVAFVYGLPRAVALIDALGSGAPRLVEAGSDASPGPGGSGPSST